MSTAMDTEGTAATIEEQAATVLMPLAAGFVGHRSVAIGLRQGLFAVLADHPDGLTPASLAADLGFDAFYVEVWCRAALAAGVLEAAGEQYRLAPHVDTLLLDDAAPGHVGPVFTLMEQPEMFDRFEEALATGDRTWWDGASPAFVENVAGTGRPFYTRLVPEGLRRVPGLEDRLSGSCRILDTACGAGAGVVRLADTYPEAEVIGADGDAHSLELAERRVTDAGQADRVDFVHTPLEDLELDEDVTLVVNNISMHECRDLDQVTANVHDVLEPGGWFVISDLPFPDTVEGLRSIPGRVMTGIQFWEAQIDDQLLPRHAYDDLLERHGFRELGAFELTPVHAVTYGRA